VTVNSPLLSLVANQFVFFGLIVGELILVFVLSARVMTMAPATAVGLFFLYAALNGVTMSLIFLVYTASSIAMTFVATAALFGAMTLLGYTTQVDLTRLGGILIMALLGLIIGSVINFFFASDGLYWILTYAGILIFVGLTAYDAQHIKNMTLMALQQGDEAVEQRVGILGALRLYLDFINLFLLLLRVMGGRRR
jgi:FtsH-binding integral membrane protein